MIPRLMIDAHEDIAYNAIALGRDFLASASEKRAQEGSSPRDGTAMTGLPDALRGNVRVIFSTLYVAPRASEPRFPGSVYDTAEEAEAAAREQLAYYAQVTRDPRLNWIKQRADLEQVVNSTEPRVGLVVLMEGADPIVKPEDARSWFDAGVRIVGPAWHGTRYSGGTHTPGPLTPLGRALMPELARAGLILDTSHMAEESFFQALDLFEGTVIASHSNVRKFVPTDRQLSDEMIRALIARDGVIGIVLFNSFLKAGWREAGAHKQDVSLATAVDHLKYICDLAGDARNVGIGTDFDGGFGVESAPRELDTVADLSKFSDALSAANFGDEDIDHILGGNWLRILRHALPER